VPTDDRGSPGRGAFENRFGRRALVHGSLAVGATIAGSSLLPHLAGAAAPGDVQRIIVVLTCMDYRIDPLTFSDIGVRTAHSYIIRNAGGRVDEGIRSIVVCQEMLGTSELFVVHHTDCGMGKFANDEFVGQLKDKFGSEASFNFLTFTNLEQSVGDDLQTLRNHPMMPREIPITGFVYDVNSKHLTPVGSS
jgi:carbonic anhydrase